LAGLASAALLTLALGANDIHRCSDGGRVVFQDKPCAGAGVSIRLDGDTASAQAELRRWLEADKASRGAQPAATEAPTSSRPVAGEAQLAVCSERFLACASDDAAAMDGCVAALPRCGGASSACCPAACIDRYQSLRGEGHGLASAVRLALLDPAQPSCASR
jgi:hypothetical protein